MEWWVVAGYKDLFHAGSLCEWNVFQDDSECNIISSPFFIGVAIFTVSSFCIFDLLVTALFAVSTAVCSSQTWRRLEVFCLLGFFLLVRSDKNCCSLKNYLLWASVGPRSSICSLTVAFPESTKRMRCTMEQGWRFWLWEQVTRLVSLETQDPALGRCCARTSSSAFFLQLQFIKILWELRGRSVSFRQLLCKKIFHSYLKTSRTGNVTVFFAKISPHILSKSLQNKFPAFFCFYYAFF